MSIASRAARAPLVLAVALAVRAVALASGASLAPDETVKRYLQSIKDGKFETAYELVSRAMRAGKDRDAWAKEQREGASWADVRIFGFEVGSAKVEGDKAYVPDVLSSQDKFVNQLGLTEYELYTLVREDGAWKVDQQVIVEPGDVPKWFPQARKGAEAGAPTAPPPTKADAPAPSAPQRGVSPGSH